MADTFAIDSLRRCALFEGCDETVLENVVRQLRRRRFRRNEVIFHQGDPGDSLHIVDEGSVKIILPSPDGEEAIIATLRQGDGQAPQGRLIGRWGDDMVDSSERTGVGDRRAGRCDLPLAVGRKDPR